MYSVVGLMSFSLLELDIDIRLVPMTITLLISALILMPAIVFRRWYFYRKRIKKTRISVSYEPPLGLNPAEVSYLFKSKLGDQDVAATIIDLAQRGLLSYRVDDGIRMVYAGPKVEDDLKTYEKKLIVEAENNHGITATDLVARFTKDSNKDKRSWSSREIVFTRFVHDDLKRKGYVNDVYYLKYFAGVFRILAILIILFVFLPLLSLWIYKIILSGAGDFRSLMRLFGYGAGFSLISLPVFFIASIVLQTIRGRLTGRDWLTTSKSHRFWPQIVGYRQFVRLTRSNKLDFETTDIEKKSHVFTLPYAVALGFVKDWKRLLR